MGTSAQPLLQPIAADLDRAGTRLGAGPRSGRSWQRRPLRRLGLDRPRPTLSAGAATLRTRENLDMLTASADGARDDARARGRI